MELKNALQSVGVFASKLHGQLDDKSEPEAAFEKVIRGGYLLSSDALGGVLMAETEANEYRLLVNDVCLSVARRFGKGKSADELHISKGAIESAIQTTILKALDVRKEDTESFEKRLATCLDELKATVLTKPEPWLVHMEVRGLAPELLPYRFGEIEFYVSGTPREEDQPTSESKNPSETVEESTVPPSNNKFGNLFAPNKGAIYGTVPVEATDTEAAKVLAERKLRVTLDALNFFGDFFEVLETKVTLPGDATVSEVKTFVWSVTRPQEKHTSVGHTKQFLRFSFAAIGASSAKDSGFDRVSSMLANPSANSLDEKILSSLQWAGRASIESRREEAFLLFCISLEALLLTNRTTEITQTFAFRGAHLIVRDAAHREEAFKDLKHLYGIRSSIVHSGRTRVMEADLSKIRWLAKTAVLTMLVGEPFSKMKTEQELENWFQTQLLAGTVPSHARV
jgi:hypothetical protein